MLLSGPMTRDRGDPDAACREVLQFDTKAGRDEGGSESMAALLLSGFGLVTESIYVCDVCWCWALILFSLRGAYAGSIMLQAAAR